MKKVLFILLLAPAWIKAQKFQVYKGDTINRIDERGLKQGIWKRYYPNDTLFSIAFFKDGKQINESKTFYRSGRLKTHLRFDPSGKTATVVNYYEQGSIMATGFYYNEKKDSLWSYFNESGKPTATESYQKGQKQGVWKIYYPEGNVAEETHWKNDRREGIHKSYFADGRLKFSATYKNDRLEGSATLFYPDGRKRLSGIYRKGLKEGEWIYYREDGSVEYIEKFKNGFSLNPREPEKE